MKKNLFSLLSALVLVSLMLAACGPAVTATEAPAAATEAPAAATEAPTAEPTAIPDVPVATFDGTTLSVPECGNGYTGLIKSVAATDASTVTFTLCRPDPAFLSKIAFSPFAIYSSD